MFPKTQKVSTFPVNAGDVVLRDQPWIYSLFLERVPHYCYRCFSPLEWETDACDHIVPNRVLYRNGTNGHGPKSVIECSGCGIPKYCSTRCQTTDMGCQYRHGGECKLLQALQAKNITVTHDLLLVLKIIFRLKMEKTGDFPAGRQLCDPPNERTYNRLLSHTEELAESDTRLHYVQNLHQSLVAVLPERDLPDLQHLMDMHWKATVNSFDIRTPYLQRIGDGLYLGASEFDHSCQRNVAVYFEGTSIVMKAIAPIAKWTDVRVTYTEIFTATALRQQNLQDWFYFRCACHLCAGDSDKNVEIRSRQCCASRSLKEKAEGKTYRTNLPSPPPDNPDANGDKVQSSWSPTYDWSDFNWHDNTGRTLRSIHRKLPFDFEEYVSIERLTRNPLAKCQLEEAEEPCRRMLEEAAKVLPSDAIALSLIHATLGKVMLSMGRERLRETADQFDLSLPGLRRVVSKFDPRLGLQLLITGLLHAQVGDISLAGKQAQEAGKILAVCDGVGRPLYKLAIRLEKFASDRLAKNGFVFDYQMAAGLRTLTDTGPNGVLCCSLFPGCTR